MSDPVRIHVDGIEHEVQPGTSVSAALLNLRVKWPTGLSGLGGPVCGMGVCFECAVLIDGLWDRSCQRICVDGMRIETRRA